SNRRAPRSQKYYEIAVFTVTQAGAAGRYSQDVAGLEFRGPFLLAFAIGQQLGNLLQQAMSDAPLAPNEFAVYSALRLMQPTTPTQLAGTLGMKATTLSSMLVRMSRSGHLKRRRNPADG